MLNVLIWMINAWYLQIVKFCKIVNNQLIVYWVEQNASPKINAKISLPLLTVKMDLNQILFVYGIKLTNLIVNKY